MGKFILTNKTDLIQTPVNAEFAESDYATVLPNGELVQFKYVDERSKREPVIVNPGIWSITQNQV